VINNHGGRQKRSRHWPTLINRTWRELIESRRVDSIRTA